MAGLERILVVDDEPDIQAIVRIALEALGGFTVEVCGSGAEALEKVSSFTPDLILLDVMMPGMDGPSVMATLREFPRTAAIPVAFMTAKVQAHEIARFKKLGAMDVIAKPLDPMTLAANINKIWSLHHG